MFTAVIAIHVKPEFREAFIRATLENARHSVLEPGIARFDFLQQADDPNRFLLYEIYRSPEAQQAHRETAHYLAWRAAAEPMMAEPRVPIRYHNLSPVE